MRLVIGDLVQWETQGVFFFEKPRAVQGVHNHDGKQFVIVEDGPTGIPISQIKIIERCLDHYGDGKWRCPNCQESWASKLLHKHQVPIPCFCPRCDQELTFIPGTKNGDA